MKHPFHIAVLILTAGDPLPLDLIAELLSLGIDVSELEARYAA